MQQKLQQIHKPSLPGEEFWKRKNISLFVSTASHYMNVKLITIFLLLSQIFKILLKASNLLKQILL